MIEKYAPARVIHALIKNPEESSLRDIAKKSEVSASTAKYCLDWLKTKRIVTKTEVGRTHLYTLNQESILARQLKILATLNEINDTRLVEELLEKNPQTNSITLYGSTARGEDTPESDIDLLLINRKKTRPRAPEAEKKLTREVNCITYTPHEWRTKAKKNKPFYDRVITEGIPLYGDTPVVT